MRSAIEPIPARASSSNVRSLLAVLMGWWKDVLTSPSIPRHELEGHEPSLKKSPKWRLTSLKHDKTQVQYHMSLTLVRVDRNLPRHSSGVQVPN